MSADDGIPSSQQVDQILGSSKLARAIENDRYKPLLDAAPVAVAISRGSGGEQHIVYANKAFERLMTMASNDVPPAIRSAALRASSAFGNTICCTARFSAVV